MSDLPIQFSGPMIRALLEGRKTQTRRVMKLKKGLTIADLKRDGSMEPVGDGWQHVIPARHQLASPRYATGDRLWVREAWRLPSNWDDRTGAQTVASCLEAGWERAWAPIAYEADGARANWGEWRQEEPGRYRHARFMPRPYSRLTLIVTDVRVERLQDISEEDARAEGLTEITKDGNLWKWGIPDRDGLPGTDDDGWPWQDWCADPRMAYAKLWNSLHGDSGWQANPWVAATTFTVHRCNIDAMDKANG